jgi:hypothetical protein
MKADAFPDRRGGSRKNVTRPGGQPASHSEGSEIHELLGRFRFSPFIDPTSGTVTVRRYFSEAMVSLHIRRGAPGPGGFSSLLVGFREQNTKGFPSKPGYDVAGAPFRVGETIESPPAGSGTLNIMTSYRPHPS